MENNLKGTRGLRRLLNAGGYSLSGLAAAVRHETAFRQELVMAVLLIPVGLYFGSTKADKALLVGSVVLVLVVELLNSAIESLTDRVSLEVHPLAKRTKDMGSAAVLASMMAMALVWGIILL